MARLLSAVALVAAIVGTPFEPAPAQNGGPAVKMSRSSICHPRGGTYYGRTIHYTPYRTMRACINAGGRPPRR